MRRSCKSQHRRNIVCVARFGLAAIDSSPVSGITSCPLAFVCIKVGEKSEPCAHDLFPAGYIRGSSEGADGLRLIVSLGAPSKDIGATEFVVDHS